MMFARRSLGTSPRLMLKEQVIGPLAVMIMRLSTATRRLQHGRLQSYILYVLAGLVALGIFVLLGAKS